MKITPRTEAETQRRKRLLRPIWHKARIMEAIDKLSKSGNDMIELTISIVDAEGNEHLLPDWLTASERFAAKVRHAAEAVGAIEQYDAGEIDQADFVGQEVEVKVSIEKRRGYPDQNRVDDYRPVSSGTASLRAAE